MPDLTPDIESAATDPSSASSDGQSATARPLPDVIAADQYLKGADAVSGTNPRGGPKSGWRTVRQARQVPPGAV